MAKPPEYIAFVGDIHAGSYWGLNPSGRLPCGNRAIGPKYLLHCWDELWKWMPAKLDALYLMGDLIDGDQRKSHSTGLFTADISEQAEYAEELLKGPCKRAAVVRRAKGTPYHESHVNILAALDKELKVKQTAWMLDNKLGSHILNVAHHPSGGSALYMGTKVDKEALWSSIAAARGKVHRPRWIVRAHLHEYMNQDTEDCTVVINPAFKLISPYEIKQNYWRWQPTLGACLMRRDSMHPSGYSFIAKTFPLPITALADLEDVV